MMGNGVRTGIHTCTAPGVKIGKNTFINAQTMIIQDIPDDSFVKIKESEDLDIRKNKHTTGEMRDRKTFREQLK
jgi:serine acetyltransferase